MKAKSVFALFFLFSVCLLFQTAMVSEATAQDITETGIDFLTQSPMEEVVYTAGEGTVTYTPAENDKNAVITLENATINGSTKAYYQDASAATAAILAAGNIDLVLMGENRITITKAYNNGLFFFNGNVTVKGPGSLAVDTTAAALNGPPAFFVLNGKNATADMGNFILESGDIRIQVQEKNVSYGLQVSKNVMINGGFLTIEGGSVSVVSTGGSISIAGGTVACKNFDDYGVETYNGDIMITGDDTKVHISTTEKNRSTIGIIADKSAGGPEICLDGGTVTVSAGQCGIFSNNDGSIVISGGTLTAVAENNDNAGDAVGICAYGEIAITGGTVIASGTGGEAVASLGIDSGSVPITVNGGKVTAKGLAKAVSCAPNVNEFQNFEIMAASDFEGMNTEPYIPEKIDGYRYLQIAPVQGKYEITYKNEKAIVEASLPTSATILFAAYDTTGRLADLEIQNIFLMKGTNTIVPDLFSFNKGQNIKIMLWSSMESLKPLCTAELVAESA